MILGTTNRGITRHPPREAKEDHKKRAAKIMTNPIINRQVATRDPITLPLTMMLALGSHGNPQLGFAAQEQE